MPSVAFLVALGREATNDNHERLPRAFAQRGWDVARIEHASLVIESLTLTGTDENGVTHDLAQFDRIWLIGFGDQPTFLDRMQFLRALDQSRFVNTIDAMTYVHGKPHLLMTELGRVHPETVVGGTDALLAALRSGGEWIGKPTAGSFGRDVFELSLEDPNHRVIVEHLTFSGYAMLQRRVDISDEKRVLVAGTQVIGTYGKAHADHRGNVAAGSTATLAKPTPDEVNLVATCIEQLGPMGVTFATLDIAFPYLLDVNVANPGWLETYERLSGVDLGPEVAAALA